jgi:hypothetical protein
MKIHPENTESRREFLLKSSRIGLACGAMSFCFCNHLAAEESLDNPVPDPRKLNYCSWACEADCPMKTAGESGDIEKKKAAYEMWHVKENFGLEFEPDQIFCNGCKTDKKELGAVVSHCLIRKCAIEKKLDGCIQCDELVSCDKIPPDFHKNVMEMQKKHQASMG